MDCVIALYAHVIGYFPETYGLSLNLYIYIERESSEFFSLNRRKGFKLSKSHTSLDDSHLSIFHILFIFRHISSAFGPEREEEGGWQVSSGEGRGLEFHIYSRGRARNFSKSHEGLWLVGISHTYFHNSHLASVDSGSYFFIFPSHFFIFLQRFVPKGGGQEDRFQGMPS